MQQGSGEPLARCFNRMVQMQQIVFLLDSLISIETEELSQFVISNVSTNNLVKDRIINETVNYPPMYLLPRLAEQNWLVVYR